VDWEERSKGRQRMHTRVHATFSLRGPCDRKFFKLGFSTILPSVTKPGRTMHEIFSEIEPCSAIVMESSRRDLSNVMAEHRSILKNHQNKNPCLIFTPQTGMNSAQVFRFYCYLNECFVLTNLHLEGAFLTHFTQLKSTDRTSSAQDDCHMFTKEFLTKEK